MPGLDMDAESAVLAIDPENRRRLSVMSQQAYGPVTDVPRIVAMLLLHELRATFFCPGYSAERHCDLVRRVLDDGHEVAHHGYLHEAIQGVSMQQEADLLDRGLDALERITGQRPVGYRAPMWETTSATAHEASSRSRSRGRSMIGSSTGTYRTFSDQGSSRIQLRACQRGTLNWLRRTPKARVSRSPLIRFFRDDSVGCEPWKNWSPQ